MPREQRGKGSYLGAVQGKKAQFYWDSDTETACREGEGAKRVEHTAKVCIRQSKIIQERLAEREARLNQSALRKV